VGSKPGIFLKFQIIIIIIIIIIIDFSGVRKRTHHAEILKVSSLLSDHRPTFYLHFPISCVLDVPTNHTLLDLIILLTTGEANKL
jgi:hypothetical protein